MYLDYVHAKFSKEHVRTVDAYIKDFIQHHGDKTTEVCRAYMLDDLIDGHTNWSNNTKRRYRITVVAAFNWLLHREMVSKNPFGKSKNYSVQYRGSEAVMGTDTLATLIKESPQWLLSPA